jgi:hypothetical protein
MFSTLFLLSLYCYRSTFSAWLWTVTAAGSSSATGLLSVGGLNSQSVGLWAELAWMRRKVESSNLPQEKHVFDQVAPVRTTHSNVGLLSPLYTRIHYSLRYAQQTARRHPDLNSRIVSLHPRIEYRFILYERITSPRMPWICRLPNRIEFWLQNLNIPSTSG